MRVKYTGYQTYGAERRLAAYVLAHAVTAVGFWSPGSGAESARAILAVEMGLIYPVTENGMAGFRSNLTRAPSGDFANIGCDL
jgi:tryptophan synthase alpha subunit